MSQDTKARMAALRERIKTPNPVKPQPMDLPRLRRGALALLLGILLFLMVGALQPQLRPLLSFLPPGAVTALVVSAGVVGAALWIYGQFLLGSSRRLNTLMGFGTRISREKEAQSYSQYSWRNPAPQKFVLDEFDFHLRAEAFRISFQIVFSLTVVVLVIHVVQTLWAVHVMADSGAVVSPNWRFGPEAIFVGIGLFYLPRAVFVWLARTDAIND